MNTTLKVGVSMGLIFGGAIQYAFPEFVGAFAKPIKTSIEHRELLGLISFIGGLIVFYMPTNSGN